MGELGKREFYGEYQKVSEELENLKQAHLCLIDLIESKEVSIDAVTRANTNQIIKNWKAESFKNASMGRSHSNSLATVNLNESISNLSSGKKQSQKSSHSKRHGKKSQRQHFEFDKILEVDEYSSQYDYDGKENVHYNANPTLSRIFNCGVFDDKDDNNELSIN